MLCMRKQIDRDDTSRDKRIARKGVRRRSGQGNKVGHGGFSVAADEDQVLDLGGSQGCYGFGMEAGPRRVHNGHSVGVPTTTEEIRQCVLCPA